MAAEQGDNDIEMDPNNQQSQPGFNTMNHIQIHQQKWKDMTNTFGSEFPADINFAHGSMRQLINQSLMCLNLVKIHESVECRPTFSKYMI